MTDKFKVQGGYQPPNGAKPSAPTTGSGVFRYTTAEVKNLENRTGDEKRKWPR